MPKLSSFATKTKNKIVVQTENKSNLEILIDRYKTSIQYYDREFAAKAFVTMGILRDKIKVFQIRSNREVREWHCGARRWRRWI